MPSLLNFKLSDGILNATNEKIIYSFFKINILKTLILRNNRIKYNFKLLAEALHYSEIDYLVIEKMINVEPKSIEFLFQGMILNNSIMCLELVNLDL